MIMFLFCYAISQLNLVEKKLSFDYSSVCMIMTFLNVTKQNQYLLTFMFRFGFSDVINGQVITSYISKGKRDLIKVIKINYIYKNILLKHIL